MNSIIEAQQTLEEEQGKELERCKEDPAYFYETYVFINGRPAILDSFRRDMLNRYASASYFQHRNHGIQMPSTPPYLRTRSNGF